jgi:hypothetical protein
VRRDASEAAQKQAIRRIDLNAARWNRLDLLARNDGQCPRALADFRWQQALLAIQGEDRLVAAGGKGDIPFVADDQPIQLGQALADRRLQAK